uniref:Regulatory factor X5 n=1 Tax=Leptobrachium leishanense TaxID=445787 RepID=A0A8C5R4Z0_9ANUR
MTSIISYYDKLYLYLQLPPGPSAPEKSLDMGCVSTAEHMYACTWIRNHLEEHTDTCLPKQDVYDAYKRYCDNLCGRPLSVANFGKIIREIFPNIKARRLGGRGQSKYPFTLIGLRRKSMVSMPPLPSLDLKMTESSELTDLVQSYNNDVINASCSLICDWAEKILKRSFNNVVEVAQFLIQQHIINPRSANAELVLSMVLSGKPLRNDLKNAEQQRSNKATPPPQSNAPIPPPQVKKRPPETQKVASSPQVDALMARLPILLPRMPPDDKVLNAIPPIRINPPVLAPNILSAPLNPLPFTAVPSGVPLTVTAGMNGTGLVSQPVAPSVISMILPERLSLESHSLKNMTQNGSMKDLASGGDSRMMKRQSVAISAAGSEAPSKRKRGRPRKVDVVSKPSIQATSRTDCATGEDTNCAQTKDIHKDPACPSVSLSTTADPATQEKLIEQACIEAPEELMGKTDVQETPDTLGSTDKPETQSTGDSRNTADTAPIQVSVIQDGRVAQWTVKRGSNEIKPNVSQEVPGSGSGDLNKDSEAAQA